MRTGRMALRHLRPKLVEPAGGAAGALVGDGEAELHAEVGGGLDGAEAGEGALHSAEGIELGVAGVAGLEVRGDGLHAAAADGSVEVCGE